MPRRASRYPTELELDILKILWRQGPGRVRDVRRGLAPRRKLAYTTVMTMMKIMVDKKYLARRKDGDSFVYRSLVTRKKTTGRMLRDLLKRAFDGSAAALVLNLLDSDGLDADEIRKLTEILDRKSKEAGN